MMNHTARILLVGCIVSTSVLTTQPAVSPQNDWLKPVLFGSGVVAVACLIGKGISNYFAQKAKEKSDRIENWTPKLENVGYDADQAATIAGEKNAAELALITEWAPKLIGIGLEKELALDVAQKKCKQHLDAVELLHTVGLPIDWLGRIAQDLTINKEDCDDLFIAIQDQKIVDWFLIKRSEERVKASVDTVGSLVSAEIARLRARAQAAEMRR
jgi:hypothetical protein